MFSVDFDFLSLISASHVPIAKLSLWVSKDGKVLRRTYKNVSRKRCLGTSGSRILASEIEFSFSPLVTLRKCLSLLLMHNFRVLWIMLKKMNSLQQPSGTMWKDLSLVILSSRKDSTRRTRFQIPSGISWNRHSRMFFNLFPLFCRSVRRGARSDVQRELGDMEKKKQMSSVVICGAVPTVHSAVAVS